MSKIADAARTAHPRPPRTGEWLPEHLVPVAAQIAGTIRDYDLADVHGLVAEVPDDERDGLILVLAAMVDPDRAPADLLDWTTRPAQSRDGRDRIPAPAGHTVCPDCGKVVRRDHLSRHRGKRQCKPAANRAA